MWTLRHPDASSTAVKDLHSQLLQVTKSNHIWSLETHSRHMKMPGVNGYTSCPSLMIRSLKMDINTQCEQGPRSKVGCFSISLMLNNFHYMVRQALIYILLLPCKNDIYVEKPLEKQLRRSHLYFRSSLHRAHAFLEMCWALFSTNESKNLHFWKSYMIRKLSPRKK